MSKISHSNPNLDDVLHEGNRKYATGYTHAQIKLGKDRTGHLIHEGWSLGRMLAEAYLQGIKDAARLKKEI